MTPIRPTTAARARWVGFGVDAAVLPIGPPASNRIRFDSYAPAYRFLLHVCHLILSNQTGTKTGLHCQFFTVTDTSGITTQYPSGRMWPANEIAALLLECSSHYAVTGCPVSCELRFVSRQAVILFNSDSLIPPPSPPTATRFSPAAV